MAAMPIVYLTRESRRDKLDPGKAVHIDIIKRA